MQWTKSHILKHGWREELVVRVLEHESNHCADGRQIVMRDAFVADHHIAAPSQSTKTIQNSLYILNYYQSKKIIKHPHATFGSKFVSGTSLSQELDKTQKLEAIQLKLQKQYQYNNSNTFQSIQSKRQ